MPDSAPTAGVPVCPTPIPCRQGCRQVCRSRRLREVLEGERVGSRRGCRDRAYEGQVAQELGVSVSAVRRMEGKALHPRLVEGTWRFDAYEVDNVRKVSRPALGIGIIGPGSGM